MKTRRRPSFVIRRQSPAQESSRPATIGRRAHGDGNGNEPERSRALRIIIAALGIVVVLAGIGLAALFTMPSIEQVSPRGATSDATPLLEVRVVHGWGLAADDIQATIDGRSVADRVTVERDLIRIAAPPGLSDGRHGVEVTARGVGPLRRTLTTSWSFVIDTTKPGIAVRLPKVPDAAKRVIASDVAAMASRRQPIGVRTEPGAVVLATSSAAGTRPVEVEADDRGLARVVTNLAEGEQSLRITTTDTVGNTSSYGVRVLVDSVGPKLAAKVPLLTRDSELDLSITLRDALGVEAQVVFDGGADGIVLTAIDADGNAIDETGGAGISEEDAEGNASSEAEPDADKPVDEVGGDVVAGVAIGVTESAAAGDEVAMEIGDASDSGREGEDEEPLPPVARYRLTSEAPLYEGRHELTITARDSLGNVATTTRAIIVDSSEALTDVEGLRKGARGADVRELHLALIKERAATRAQLGVDFNRRTYGQPSRAAVSAYQSTHALDVDGMAGRATIASLLFRIVIDQASHTLTLYSGDKVVKRYGVAVGQAAYPTPNGEFHIVSMQRDPTWTPPDSDWAKGAKPIPPGPDNPLGTRWMGLDAPGGTVGIHGTNNPSSIGGSVSHGCIRMAIPDVEDLFERVEAGTPVTIQ